MAPSTVPAAFVQDCLSKLTAFRAKVGVAASAVIFRSGFGILGGSEQTVPVGELAALTAPLREERVGHPWLLVTDHANHVKGWRKGRAACPNSSLSDRWRKARQLKIWWGRKSEDEQIEWYREQYSVGVGEDQSSRRAWENMDSIDDWIPLAVYEERQLPRG